MTAACRNADSNREPEWNDSPDWTVSEHDGERFRLLVENSHDIIVEVSAQREILYVSPNVSLVLGYTSHDLVGADVFGLVHPDDQADAVLQFERRTGRATARHHHKSGAWRWLETSGREFTRADGTTRRVLIARDVTAEHEAMAERERLQSELARAEKLSALGTLAGGMAHDFNNLLTAIFAYVGLAQTYPLDPDVNDALQQVIRATERAKGIAQHMLDFSGHQNRPRHPVQISAISREVVQLLRPMIPANVEVIASLPDDLPPVLANATQLHQILVNLCHNALHALRHTMRGRLIVQVSIVQVDEASAQEHFGLRPGSHVCLAVIDNGHGMDAETQRRIFEPFFTTKPDGVGTGLGLAVVQRIVREHRGVVQVSSRLGEGTALQVFLPVHRGSAPSGTAPS
jgi:PAS domain S-box-containing protein